MYSEHRSSHNSQPQVVSLEALLLAVRLNLVEVQGFSGHLPVHSLRISLAGFSEEQELEVILVAGFNRS